MVPPAETTEEHFDTDLADTYGKVETDSPEDRDSQECRDSPTDTSSTANTNAGPTDDTDSSTGEPDREPEYLNGLEIVESGLMYWGGSYEGYRVYDVSELDSGNPWSADIPLDTLPVFRNLAANPFHHFGGQVVYLSEDDMLTILYSEAGRLGKEVQRVAYDIVYRFGKGKTLPGNDALPKAVWGICDDVTIEVNSLGEIRYIYDGTYLLTFFDDKEELFSMTAGHKEIDVSSLGDPYSYTDTEVRELVDMINRMYPGTLSLAVPTPSCRVAYNFFGEKSITGLCAFYDKVSDYTESIINYNFNRYDLYLTQDFENVTTFGMPAEMSTYTEKLGDYPVIGADEAEELLLNGAYLTTVPSTELEDGTVNTDSVHMCELIYLTSSLNEYFIPYYKFYVELPYSKSIAERKGWDTRLKRYGAFYVPAVEADYISNYSPFVNGIMSAD